MYRVILVDDEAIFLDFMRSVIDWGSWQCEIVGCAEDGRRALDLIRKQKPDISFVDVNIPLADGLEVCRQVREKGLNTKLVIVTAHDEFQIAYQAIKMGINDFLLKPFDREELEKCLKKVLLELSGTEQSAEVERAEESSTKFELMAAAIDDYLEKHYSDSKLSLQTLSLDMSFESSYLRRIYKAARGITIMQRLESIRLEAARRLLTSSRYQVQEISAMTGFSDTYYFSKRFKQMTGVTPTAYRNGKRMDLDGI